MFAQFAHESGGGLMVAWTNPLRQLRFSSVIARVAHLFIATFLYFLPPSEERTYSESVYSLYPASAQTDNASGELGFNRKRSLSWSNKNVIIHNTRSDVKKRSWQL